MTMIKKFWEDMFRYQGVLSRKDYWISTVVNAFLAFVLFYIVTFTLGLIGGLTGADTNTLEAIAIFMFIIIFIVYFFACITASIKRLRDAGLSTWWVLLMFVPALNIIMLVLLSLKTKQELVNEVILE